mgnify:CR=1 FL=1
MGKSYRDQLLAAMREVLPSGLFRGCRSAAVYLGRRSGWHTPPC